MSSFGKVDQNSAPESVDDYFSDLDLGEFARTHRRATIVETFQAMEPFIPPDDAYTFAVMAFSRIADNASAGERNTFVELISKILPRLTEEKNQGLFEFAGFVCHLIHYPQYWTREALPDMQRVIQHLNEHLGDRAITAVFRPDFDPAKVRGSLEGPSIRQ
jgi:hypothetical protein